MIYLVEKYFDRATAIYSVTITNGCFTRTATISTANMQPLTGALPNQGSSIGNLWNTTAFIPGSSTQRFIFYEIGIPAGTAPAYHANAYTLDIHDRWGNLVYSKYVSAPCEGFHNGDINWNGMRNVTNAGTLVPGNAVYGYQLTLYNCSGNKYYKGDVTAVQ